MRLASATSGACFPPTRRTPRGIASDALLRTVVERLAAARPRARARVDLVIIGARPKLGARLDAMRDARSRRRSGVDEGAVNVKASTGNLAGDEGAGRSISARAVATVRERRA